MLKQTQGPLSEDDIFLSNSTEQITWGELHDNLDAKIKRLKEHGIGPHVVFVIAEDQVTIDDYLWILASIKNGGSASQADATQSKTEIDNLIKCCKASCIIRSNEIQMLNDPKETGPTILHPNEIYRNMTSGTTAKEFFEMYPSFWDFKEHDEAIGVDGQTIVGCTTWSLNGHLLAVAPEFTKDKRPYVLGTPRLTATYNPYNLLRMYQVGGGFHMLNGGDNVPEEIKRVKPNICISYPNAVKRVVDSCPEDFNWTGIDYWEFAGGHTPETIVRNIEKKFKFKALYNVMASTEADCHTRAVYKPGDPIKNFYGFRETIHNGELKLDEKGVLWYKYGTLDWMTDGDKLRDEDGIWYYEGRIFDDVIFMKGGVKVYTGLIEAVALEVSGVKNVASCEKDELHYLLYTGTANANDVANHFINTIQEYKQPHYIFHVTEPLFFSGHIKVQKRKLPDIVNNASVDQIISKVIVKHHSKV